MPTLIFWVGQKVHLDFSMLGNISGQQNFGHTDFSTNWIQLTEIFHWKHKLLFFFFKLDELILTFLSQLWTMQITHPLMAEREEELKSLLLKMKEESEKADLKLTMQKTKIMASGPITSWQIDGETMETDRLYFLGLQNHCRWWLQPWN